MSVNFTPNFKFDLLGGIRGKTDKYRYVYFHCTFIFMLVHYFQCNLYVCSFSLLCCRPSLVCVILVDLMDPDSTHACLAFTSVVTGPIIFNIMLSPKTITLVRLLITVFCHSSLLHCFFSLMSVECLCFILILSNHSGIICIYFGLIPMCCIIGVVLFQLWT